ncbi:hypothetical protein TSAR_011568, partial [Trichomalopsis sarcophagae]
NTDNDSETVNINSENHILLQDNQVNQDNINQTVHNENRQENENMSIQGEAAGGAALRPPNKLSVKDVASYVPEYD